MALVAVWLEKVSVYSAVPADGVPGEPGAAAAGAVVVAVVATTPDSRAMTRAVDAVMAPVGRSHFGHRRVARTRLPRPTFRGFDDPGSPGSSFHCVRILALGIHCPAPKIVLTVRNVTRGVVGVHRKVAR
jgi:hypothetical protein